MAQPFPYTYVSCPCSGVSVGKARRPRRSLSRDLAVNSDASTQQGDGDLDGNDEQEKTFNPHHPRSAYSLFPPEYLLYCEECNSLKCPRCVTEEIICTYCPSCLFEVPSSQVKQDLNRCSRNCFCCPICTSQLVTTSLGGFSGSNNSTSTSKDEGPWVLSCNHCMWTSADIGITFSKPQNLRSQIEKIANGGKPQTGFRDSNKEELRKGISRAIERDKAGRSGSLLATTSRLEEQGQTDVDSDKNLANELASNPHARFQALKAFYKDQLAQSGEGPAYSGGLDYSSSSITRLMNMYTNPGSSAFRKAKVHYTAMREALTPAEGLVTSPLPPLSSTHETAPQDPGQLSSDSPAPTEERPIEHLEYIDTITPTQQISQLPSPLGNPDATQVSHLRPMPTLLRTKRAKRCTTCQHILAKPEFKVTSTRYRIKLVALNYIPYVTLRPLQTTTSTSPVPDIPIPGIDGSPTITLQPYKPSQWIMTLRNPLFEHVTVSLGCPSVTPGKLGHKITILCPAFSIGPSGDVWDDALNNTTTSTAKLAITTSTIGGGTTAGGEQVAGRPYDSGRNWTSVVIEIIPAAPLPKPAIKPSPDTSSATRDSHDDGEQSDTSEDNEDDTAIEIPIRVRLEWTPTLDLDGGGKSGRKPGDDAEESPSKKPRGGDVEGDEQVDSSVRELAYWMVLGIGRVRSP